MQMQLQTTGLLTQYIHKVPHMLNLKNKPSFLNRRFQSPPVLGVMSRLENNKGIDVFLQALSILKHQNVSFLAKIAGDGRQKQYLLGLQKQYHLTNEVIFLDWVENKAEFYQQIDIFCLPSRQEVFGLVILEAMQYGLPMILADLPGPHEVVGDSQGACWFEPNHPKDLADKILKLINNPELASNMAFRAYAKADDYRQEIVGKNLSHTLKKIVQSQDLLS